MDEDEEIEPPVLRPLVWLRNTRSNVQAFPAGARKIIGDELQLIQFGGMPKDAKPFKGVGSGVIEIALRHDAEAYRTVLAVQLGRKIYVLARLSEEIEEGHCDAETRSGLDQTAV